MTRKFEIWSCEEHEAVEVFPEWIDDKNNRWMMDAHDEDLDKYCNPNRHKIPVEDIMQAFDIQAPR